jgi:hypothetical protein
MYLHFDMCEKSVRMAPTQRRVDFAFILISKEEREMNIGREFVALSEIGAEPLTRYHATFYGMLTCSELRGVQNFH